MVFLILSDNLGIQEMRVNVGVGILERDREATVGPLRLVL